MNISKFVFAISCIAAGLALISLSIRPRRRYIHLSGYRSGKIWTRRIEA